MTTAVSPRDRQHSLTALGILTAAEIDEQVRLLRDNAVVHDGRMRSLRRFKEDVTEVKSGAECGVAIENYNDVKIGDVIESYVTEKVVESAMA